MQEFQDYLLALPPARREKVESVLLYIQREYPDFKASYDFSPKTKFPVFTSPDGNNYVAVASRKAYISIHFGRHDCPAIVAEADGRIKTGVGCAKIPDSAPFPMEHIKKAIDRCFGRL